MNLRSLIVGVALAIAPAAAHAQVGLYINPAAELVTNSVADSGLYAFLGQNSKSAVFYGFDVGGYYEHKTGLPYLKAGVELHDSLLHANNAKLNNFDAGLRLSFKPFHNGFKPVVEPWIGAAASRAPFTSINVTKKIEYGITGGLEYETHHHIDFRLIDVTYGKLTTVSSATIGGAVSGGVSIPASTGVSFTSGFVFRFR